MVKKKDIKNSKSRTHIKESIPNINIQDILEDSLIKVDNGDQEFEIELSENHENEMAHFQKRKTSKKRLEEE